MKIGKEAFDKSYQNKVGQFAKKILHKNSIELLNILDKENLIKDNFHFFEIGAGGARNLWYIWNKNNNIKISCNDFWEKESKNNMHEDIKEIINFYEGDTETVLKEISAINVDVLLSSDHMMHLPREKGEAVIGLIKDKIKPKYIVLRERKLEFETPEETCDSFPRNYHNYERFLSKYDLIFEDTTGNGKYFIRIYEVKSND